MIRYKTDQKELLVDEVYLNCPEILEEIINLFFRGEKPNRTFVLPSKEKEKENENAITKNPSQTKSSL